MDPLLISERSISSAWSKAFLSLLDMPGGIRYPALISIDVSDPSIELENHTTRQLLDQELRHIGKPCCSTIAGTIFPASMWNPRLRDNAHVLYRRYEKAWRGIRKCPANRNGVYFRRLTAFDPDSPEGTPINQLEFIVETYRRGNHRKSALQASVLDPRTDHSHQRQKGFPCLQQVAFTPSDNGGMYVTGFYATQYQFEKAYGNYLGLYGLGAFMAQELGLKLTRVVCVASVLKLGDVSKSRLQHLAKEVRELDAGVQ